MSVTIGFVLERQPCLSEWQVAESFPVTPNDSDQEYALNITPKLYWPDSTTLQYNSIDTECVLADILGCPCSSFVQSVAALLGVNALLVILIAGVRLGSLCVCQYCAGSGFGSALSRGPAPLPFSQGFSLCLPLASASLKSRRTSSISGLSTLWKWNYISRMVLYLWEDEIVCVRWRSRDQTSRWNSLSLNNCSMQPYATKYLLQSDVWDFPGRATRSIRWLLVLLPLSLFGFKPKSSRTPWPSHTSFYLFS